MHSLSFPLETTGKRQRQSLIIEGGANSRNYLRLVFTAFVLNLLSAFLFIDVVNRPVYDDPYNISDVHNYAANGVSITTLRSQRNPPGPLSFLWMAAAVRLVGGEELRAARLGSVASWIFLTAVVLVAARYSNFPNLWCGALLVTLVFPHSVEATSTVLTEGPALLFAVAGALAWTEFIWQQTAERHATILGLVGGLSICLRIPSTQVEFSKEITLGGECNSFTRLCNSPGVASDLRVERSLQPRDGKWDVVQNVESRCWCEPRAPDCRHFLCCFLSGAVHFSRYTLRRCRTAN